MVLFRLVVVFLTTCVCASLLKSESQMKPQIFKAHSALTEPTQDQSPTGSGKAMYIGDKKVKVTPVSLNKLEQGKISEANPKTELSPNDPPYKLIIDDLKLALPSITLNSTEVRPETTSGTAIYSQNSSANADESNNTESDSSVTQVDIVVTDENGTSTSYSDTQEYERNTTEDQKAVYYTRTTDMQSGLSSNSSQPEETSEESEEPTSLSESTPSTSKISEGENREGVDCNDGSCDSDETEDSDEEYELAEYSQGTQQCTECTSVIVPIGQYTERIEYFTTEYDEYYLVSVPVTRHDVYTVASRNETYHSVYYTTGELTVEGNYTECEGCETTSEEASARVTEETEVSVEGKASEGEVTGSYRQNSELNAETEEEDEYISASGEEEESVYISAEEPEENAEEISYYSTNEADSDESRQDFEVYGVLKLTDSDETEVYVKGTLEGCTHCSEFIQLSKEVYPQLSGDLYDNDETDSTYLELVSPSYDTEEVSWVSDIYDGDEAEYCEDLGDSSNPEAYQESFLQVIDDPLQRDIDDLPSDIDDEGDDQVDGDFDFLLVSSFTDNTPGSGSVIVVPESSDAKFTLITGLDKPVGLCFDNNHEFLYVVDPTFGKQGYIYQFSIKWDDNDRFELRTTDYTIVYEGANPYSCFVDEYGNVFFVDATDNQINMISYLDLWSGFTNYYYTLYERNSDTTEIDTPVGITVYNSEDLYFVNSDVSTGAPILAKADAQVKGTNTGTIKRKVEGKTGAWGVAVSDDYVYFTTTDGSLWVMDKDDKTEASIKSNRYFADPRGVCYGDDDVYVADYYRGIILRFDDDDNSEDSGDLWEEIKNAYAVYCVNLGTWLSLALVWPFL